VNSRPAMFLFLAASTVASCNTKWR
jgi:predicted small secreted protein